MKLKILTLTTVYPTPTEPELGVFVQTRLRSMAGMAEIKVFTPSPIINYARRTLSLRGDTPRRSQDGAMERISSRWLYPPHAGALNGILLFLQTLLPIAVLRRSYPFDVIDAHFGHPEGVAAALLGMFLRRPFTVTMRGSEQLHGGYGVRRRIMGWALRRAARVLAVSEKLRSFAIELGVDPSRVVTIPNGIDIDLFHPHDRERSRAAFDVRPGRQLVVSAGHLIELKGHHRIIQAVRELADQGFDVELLIAGGRGRAGDFEPTLRRQISELGLDDRVRLVGHLDRNALATLMSAADVFCLASAREGWPNVLHEAMACGAPVVATNVGGVPEMIPSLQYGTVVPPDDSGGLRAALADALYRAWDRDSIAAWGQSRSWGQVAAEVIRELEAVVAENKGRETAATIRRSRTV